MVTLLRKADVEATLRESTRALQAHLRRLVRRYVLSTTLTLATGSAIAAGFWYFHCKGTRVPEEAEKLVGPFEVENLGAKPAEGIVMQWSIRMGPEQPIPRWHTTEEKQKKKAVLLEAGKAYRLRLQGGMRGVLEDSFSPAKKAGARSEATSLPPKALGSAEGIPILPEQIVLLSLRWIPDPDAPNETVTLLLDELAVPADEYRGFLESRQISIRPVYLPDP